MKTIRSTIRRMFIPLIAITFLCSFSLPVHAGRMKNDSRRSEQRDSGNVNVPAPIADDSPINPDQKGDRDKPRQGHDRDKHQKKSRR